MISHDKDALSASQFSRLLEAIQQSKSKIDATLEAKLAEFCDEVRGSQEKAAESVARKVRWEPLSFRKKENQEQFCIMEEINEALLEAEQELEATMTFSAATKKAQKSEGAHRPG